MREVERLLQPGQVDEGGVRARLVGLEAEAAELGIGEHGGDRHQAAPRVLVVLRRQRGLARKQAGLEHAERDLVAGLRAQRGGELLIDRGPAGAERHGRRCGAQGQEAAVDSQHLDAVDLLPDVPAQGHALHVQRRGHVGLQAVAHPPGQRVAEIAGAGVEREMDPPQPRQRGPLEAAPDRVADEKGAD